MNGDIDYQCSANTVGYVANNPDAYYIAAGAGALSSAGRNTLELPRTNDWDVTAIKRINITERYAVRIRRRRIQRVQSPAVHFGLLEPDRQPR